MIIVSVTNLRSDISRLNSLLKDLETIKINLFNQLKSSTINWQDGNSLDFNDNIYLEHQEADLIITNLNEKKDVYDFICNKYSEIGQKVKCDLDNKNSFINAIEECINKLNNINSRLNTIGVVEVTEAITSINNAKEQLTLLKTQAINTFNKIAEFEMEINGKIRSLERIKIQEFGFDINNIGMGGLNG